MGILSATPMLPLPQMVLRVIGRVFIVTGLLILLFLGYQLWGTNFVADRHQKALAQEFQPQSSPEPTQPAPSPIRPDVGDGVARIQIDKIGVDWIVVEGVSVSVLKKGPGHYPGTALPGQTGNVVVSGHRTTYGAPFFRLDEVKVGDIIKLHTRTDSFDYRVIESKIVAPTDLSVIVTTQESRLTLTTCHPRFSARQRLIVVAELAPPPAPEARGAQE